MRDAGDRQEHGFLYCLGLKIVSGAAQTDIRLAEVETNTFATSPYFTPSNSDLRPDI